MADENKTQLRTKRIEPMPIHHDMQNIHFPFHRYSHSFFAVAISFLKVIIKATHSIDTVKLKEGTVLG